MTIIAAGASASISLPAGQFIQVTGGSGVAQVLNMPGASPIALDGDTKIGPFADARTVSLSATVAVDYTVTDGVTVGLSPSAAAAVQALVVARPPQEMFGAYTPIIKAMLAECAGFGSSTPDTTNGLAGVTYATTLFFDPVGGTDAFSGSSASAAKKTLPQFLANNTKYLVKAGTEINLANVASAYLQVNGTGNSACLSVYDGDTASSTYGQEITWQPNPYKRGLAGRWITSAEKAKFYFKLNTGSWPGSSASTRGVQASAGNTFVVRGAQIVGATHAAARVTDGTLRLEDCVIEACKLTPSPANTYYGAVGVRTDHPSAVCSIARVWASDIGEDIFWLYEGAGHKVSDCAIRHTCDMQVYGVQHCDIVQFGSVPGDFVLRRLVVYHETKGGQYLLDSGSTEVTAVGAVVMSTGPGTTTTNAGLVEDVVYVTNRQGYNFEDQPGITLRRCVGLVVGDTSQVAGQAPNVVWQQKANVEDGCVWGRYASSTVARALIGSGASLNVSTIDFGNMSQA